MRETRPLQAGWIAGLSLCSLFAVAADPSPPRETVAPLIDKVLEGAPDAAK